MSRKILLVVAVAACGGGGNPIADSMPASDATPDGPEETTRVDITARTLDQTGNPDPTAIAIFYDEHDMPVSHGMTDANGQAHGYLPHGGTVTVLRTVKDPGSSDRTVSITTMRGVEPGDNLNFGVRPVEQLTGAQDTMIASYTPFDNSTMAMIKPCGGGAPTGSPGSPFSLVFFENCTTPTFDMLVLSFGSPREFIWMPDIPYVGGGGVTVPNTWQPMATITTTFENLPSGTTQFGVFVSILVGPLLLEMNRGQFDLSAATPSVSHQWPPGAGRGVVVRAFHGPGVDTDQHVVFDPTGPSTVAVDLAALPLPSPGRATQTAQGVSWPETGAPAGDLRYVSWLAEYVDPTQRRNLFFWTFIENPTSGTTSTTLLPLPDDYAALDPTRLLPVALTLKGSFVEYLDYDNLAGYGAARPNAQQLENIETGYVDGAHHIHRTRTP